MATIKDIARIAHLDISTVSRALNGSPRVTEATKERVRAIAADVGYNANEIARSLVTRKSRVIGLVVSDVSNPFFAEVTRGVEQEGRRAGYNTIVCNSDWDARQEQEHIRVLRGRQVDGIIIHLSEDMSASSLRELQAGNPPVVFLGHSVREGKPWFVSIDDVKGAYCAVKHLVSLGHRRIAFVSGVEKPPRRYPIMVDRIQGYRQALAEAGIPFRRELVIQTLPGIERARESTRTFLKAEHGVTAIFATSDVMALGAYRAIFEAGLRIPGDISVVGFDDIEVASVIRPALTTYEQPKALLGVLAVRMLLRHMNGERPPKNGCIVRSKGLIVRDSTAAPVATK